MGSLPGERLFCGADVALGSKDGIFIDAAGSSIEGCGTGSNMAGNGEGTPFVLPCGGAAIGCPAVGSDAVVGVRIKIVGDSVPSFAVGAAGNGKGSSVGSGPSGRGRMVGAAIIGGMEQVPGMTLFVAKQISCSASCSSCD